MSRRAQVTMRMPADTDLVTVKIERSLRGTKQSPPVQLGIASACSLVGIQIWLVEY